MYIYYLNLTMADKKIEISNEMLDAIIHACKEIKLKLESQTEVIPTRSISSITRAILKGKDRNLFDKYNKGSILNATLDSQENILF